MQPLNKLIELIKRPNYILIAAWVIPAAVLLTILYLNFLPFGYQKTLTINVGSKNDDKGEFRLEPSQFLGARQELDGQTFRYLDGLAYAVYEPKVVLRNATIEAELTASSGVSFILPPDLSNVKWDYDWNAKNIEQYFQAELSEKQIFNKFQNTTSTAITKNSFVIASETKQSTLTGISSSCVIPAKAGIQFDSKLSPLFVISTTSLRGGEIPLTSSQNQAECPKGNLCYDKGFALELQYQANRYATLLSGDLSLTQNPKELVLTYKNKKLKYQLPDYYLGEVRTVIVSFDGEKFYLTTDKNEGTKAVSLPLSPCHSGEGRNPSLTAQCDLPDITIYKTKSVQSLSFHPNKPSFINTKDDSIVLDGSTRLTMPNTADKFEDGPFTVYAEWTPEKAANGQQIIGHLNWEIWQNEKTVSFQVGRMSTSTGPIYKISYNIDETFFNKPHTLLAVYSPVSTSTESNLVTNGYIELFIDDVLAGREYFANEIIWSNYGNQNLSIGWNTHNYSQNPYFQGNIIKIKITTAHPKMGTSNKLELITNSEDQKITLPFYGNGDVYSLKINTKK